ncbi:MAG: hypothetical protein IKN51_00545 [Bacteroidaceae bacterium]|nr:hypothetical protein [Bacteroidaceae bacterium]
MLATDIAERFFITSLSAVLVQTTTFSFAHKKNPQQVMFTGLRTLRLIALCESGH